jgi:uncharacterized protein YcfJ
MIDGNCLTGDPGRRSMKRMVAMVAALSLVVAGCAQLYAPAVNLEGVDQARYEADLDQCRGEVAATAPSVPAGFIGGAVLGALAGVFVVVLAGAGAATTSASTIGTVFAAFAAIGAFMGAFLGAASAGVKTTDAVDDCLRARGYAVDA